MPPLAGLGDLHYLLYKQTLSDLDKVTDFCFAFERLKVLIIPESLGQWDQVDFVVG